MLQTLDNVLANGSLRRNNDYILYLLQFIEVEIEISIDLQLNLQEQFTGKIYFQLQNAVSP